MTFCLIIANVTLTQINDSLFAPEKFSKKDIISLSTLGTDKINAASKSLQNTEDIAQPGSAFLVKYFVTWLGR